VGTTQFTDGIGVAGRYVLTGCDGVAGCQIWGSDGSAAGTTLLWGGQPKEALNILGVGGDIAFFQDGGGLLRTDGTPAGTVELKAARLLTFSNTVISEGLRLGGRLIFTAESGTAVWASDGTTAGTLKLMGLSGSQGVGGFTRVGDTAFFFANAPPSSDAPWADNRTLWASDGTPAGTRQLVGGLPSHPIKGLTSLGNALFFIDRDDAGGQGLWRSDGTPAGTTLVKGGFYSITSVLPFADRLVFTADGQLWRSDGTAAGTTLISKDGEGGLVSVGGTLFSGICGPHTCALWASDGTAAGTRQLRVFDPPGCDRFCDQPTISDLVGAGGTLFFNASLGGTWGFWASDGTAAGTRLLSRTLPFYLSTSYTLPAIGGRVFFIAANDSHGLELWTSDGSPAGTHLVKDIWPGAGSAAPRGLTAVGNRVFFSASDDAHGRELWVSDGTAAGTQLVADINPGPEGSMPDNLTVAANGQLFFSATDGVHGTELWVSDSDGTRMVQDINPGADGASPATITAAGPNLFFSANDGAAGPALWTLPLTTQPFQRRSIDAYALIQAEDFDRGGESLAYHDTTPGNHNGAYRPDEDVDLQTAAGETYLAYAQPGEWLNYTVDIAATRVYTLELAVASLGPGGSFHLELDGTDLSGPLRVPDTGGWNRWAILSRPALSLPAGRHTLRLVLDTPGASGFIGNIDWLALDGGGDRSVLPAAWR
jgi:ELWxxDGT repeat protein